MRKLNKRSGKNVSPNQHKGKDGDSQNLRCKGIQCCNCKDFGHIQAECSHVPREQRRIFNVTNDEKGEMYHGKNVVSVKYMHIDEQSN